MISSNLEQEPQTELVAQLSQEFYNNDTIQLLLKSLEKMDFEVGGWLETILCGIEKEFDLSN